MDNSRARVRRLARKIVRMPAPEQAAFITFIHGRADEILAGHHRRLTLEEMEREITALIALYKSVDEPNQ